MADETTTTTTTEDQSTTTTTTEAPQESSTTTTTAKATPGRRQSEVDKEAAKQQEPADKNIEDAKQTGVDNAATEKASQPLESKS